MGNSSSSGLDHLCPMNLVPPRALCRCAMDPANIPAVGHTLVN